MGAGWFFGGVARAPPFRRAHGLFAAFCQGMFGHSLFANCWVFHIKPLKVIHFEQGFAESDRGLGCLAVGPPGLVLAGRAVAARGFLAGGLAASRRAGATTPAASAGGPGSSGPAAASARDPVGAGRASKLADLGSLLVMGFLDLSFSSRHSEALPFPPSPRALGLLCVVWPGACLLAGEPEPARAQALCRGQVGPFVEMGSEREPQNVLWSCRAVCFEELTMNFQPLLRIHTQIGLLTTWARRVEPARTTTRRLLCRRLPSTCAHLPPPSPFSWPNGLEIPLRRFRFRHMRHLAPGFSMGIKKNHGCAGPGRGIAAGGSLPLLCGTRSLAGICGGLGTLFTWALTQKVVPWAAAWGETQRSVNVGSPPPAWPGG